MQEITISTFPVAQGAVLDVLNANSIQVNEYARVFFSHRHFDAESLAPQITLVLCSLAELGIARDAVLTEIAAKARARGLCLCHAGTGLFLRLAYVQQPQSRNPVLSGAQRSPDGAVVAFSEFLEQDDDFPKGLYLRNVDGQLWLRGYVCDDEYRWPADTIFAFEKRAASGLKTE